MQGSVINEAIELALLNKETLLFFHLKHTGTWNSISMEILIYIQLPPRNFNLKILCVRWQIVYTWMVSLA